MKTIGSLEIFSPTVFRTQEIRLVFYFSQISTDEQKPFCEQGEPTNVCRQTTVITEFTAMYHRTLQPSLAVMLCVIG